MSNIEDNLSPQAKFVIDAARDQSLNDIDPGTLDAAVTIEVKGKKLFYDFDNLSMHQKELAMEVYRFKLDQIKAKPEKFDRVLASGGAEYKLKCLSYLFVPLNAEGEPHDFKKSKADTEVFDLVCAIKGAKNDELCQAVLSDFFTMRNAPELLSDVQEISSLDLNGIIQSAMSQMAFVTPEGSNNSATKPFGEADSSSAENSTGD